VVLKTIEKVGGCVTISHFIRPPELVLRAIQRARGKGRAASLLSAPRSLPVSRELVEDRDSAWHTAVPRTWLLSWTNRVHTAAWRLPQLPEAQLQENVGQLLKQDCELWVRSGTAVLHGLDKPGSLEDLYCKSCMNKATSWKWQWEWEVEQRDTSYRKETDGKIVVTMADNTYSSSIAWAYKCQYNSVSY
jgi:hypothetical protein